MKLGSWATLVVIGWAANAGADSFKKEDPWLDLSKNDPWLEVPKLAGVRETGSASFMWTSCELLPNTRPRQTRCTTTQTIVLAPPKEAVAEVPEALRDKWSKTCSVTLVPPYEHVFTQVNENSWSSIANGICGTTVMTLWRYQASDSNWNYSQINSVLPNAPRDSLLNCEKRPARTDWIVRDRPTLNVGCEFIQ